MLELLSEVYSKQQRVRKIVEDSNFCSNKIELTLFVLYLCFTRHRCLLKRETFIIVLVGA